MYTILCDKYSVETLSSMYLVIFHFFFKCYFKCLLNFKNLTEFSIIKLLYMRLKMQV